MGSEMIEIKNQASAIEQEIRSSETRSMESTPSPEEEEASQSPILQEQNKEIISISSTPDPITEPVPRRSRRANIGIPRERYHDPDQKHHSVEYEKRDRDSQRATQRSRSRLPRDPSEAEGSANATVDITMPIMFNDKPLYARDINIPTTYKQAEKSPFWIYWKEAMEKQLEDLAAKRTWTLIPKPPRSKVLPGQWRFTLKTNTKDQVYGFKARWVVCGNFQDKDGAESYAPVVSEYMIKVVLTLIAIYDLR
ncbi:uncharacterized protein N7500_009000 [Penicillium coprophilum]|uniref:uncharacterized protein n=1 Tax=Penicillium coprophilum TaxID=36646 RepID=UPI00238BEC71|nr:uncharacterized protein N7500_009000 [Penicillium coprophilum]KAJ5159349.1 hypothetical protein N7500_009000 [Penicillium coprophilum]